MKVMVAMRHHPQIGRAMKGEKGRGKWFVIIDIFLILGLPILI
jgi:hypothetical protein